LSFYVDAIRLGAYNEEGINRGVLVELAKRLILESDIDAEILLVPTPRITKYLIGNQADM